LVSNCTSVVSLSHTRKERAAFGVKGQLSLEDVAAGVLVVAQIDAHGNATQLQRQELVLKVGQYELAPVVVYFGLHNVHKRQAVQRNLLAILCECSHIQ